MKETEFTKSSDKKHWMDTSVLSDHPKKMTIIDPVHYVNGVLMVFDNLPWIQESDFTKPALTHLARTMVISIMQAVVNRRRAWVYGDDAEVDININFMREMIGFDLESELREELRYELNDPKNHRAALMMDNLLKTVIDDVVKHLNPNPYVIHRLTQGRDLRTLMIEEYDDWRVVQWTKSEQAKIDARHEDV